MRPTLVLFLVLVAVVILVIVISEVRKYRANPVVAVWQGLVIAVDVAVDRSAALSAQDKRQRVAYVVRNLEDEAAPLVQAPMGHPSRLPMVVKEQVYEPSWTVNDLEPNFNLPKGRLEAAQDRAFRDGYRFRLTLPVVVTCRTDASGYTTCKINREPASPAKPDLPDQPEDGTADSAGPEDAE